MPSSYTHTYRERERKKERDGEGGKNRDRHRERERITQIPTMVVKVEPPGQTDVFFLKVLPPS
jgi:hypothetical protein